VTLVDATNTPDQPTPPDETRDSEAVPTKALTFFDLPIRAQLSFIRQRIVFPIRMWFRLPSDEFREQQLEGRFDYLIELAKRQQEAIQTLTRISNQMQARLQWYETHIPRMRELKREFDREQETLLSLTGQESKEASERLRHGVLKVVS